MEIRFNAQYSRIINYTQRFAHRAQPLQTKMECNLHEGNIFKMYREKYDFSKATINSEVNGDITIILELSSGSGVLHRYEPSSS